MPVCQWHLSIDGCLIFKTHNSAMYAMYTHSISIMSTHMSSVHVSIHLYAIYTTMTIISTRNVQTMPTHKAHTRAYIQYIHSCLLTMYTIVSTHNVHNHVYTPCTQSSTFSKVFTRERLLCLVHLFTSKRPEMFYPSSPSYVWPCFQTPSRVRGRVHVLNTDLIQWRQPSCYREPHVQYCPRLPSC